MFIDTATYLNLKRLIAEYEKSTGSVESPFLIDVHIEHKYNPKYGNGRICKCGHAYHRHFDSYENMDNVGCKYCGCHNFEETPIYNDGFNGIGELEFAPISNELWAYGDRVVINNGKIQIRDVWYNLSNDYAVNININNE